MENKIEVKLAVGKETFTIWCNPGDDVGIDHRIQHAIDVQAAIMAENLAKQYVAKAIRNGLDFLHKLQ